MKWKKEEKNGWLKKKCQKWKIWKFEKINKKIS